MSGEGRHRTMWSDFYDQIDSIMFVIDSTDVKRLPVVKRYIQEMFEDELLDSKKTPIMIICTKQDDNQAIDKVMISQQLEINKMRKGQNIKYKVKAASAFKDLDRLEDCVNWLAANVDYDRFKGQSKIVES